MTAPETAGQAAQVDLRVLAYETYFTSIGGPMDGNPLPCPFGELDLAERIAWTDVVGAIRDAIAAAAPAGQAAPDKLTLHIAHDEFRQWMAGEGYDWADDSYQAEAFAAGFMRSDALWKAYGQPQAAPELAAATPPLGTAWRLLDETRAKHADLRGAVHALMADLEKSAAATAPSKKSDIELTVAERLGLLLDQP